METLNRNTTTGKHRPSRRGSRRGRKQSDASSASMGPEPVATYKSVLSSRPPTAGGDDVPVANTTDSHTSLLFSDDMWNPHSLLESPLAPLGETGLHPVPTLDADDDAFFSSLFDDILNDAEQFTAGVGVPDVDVPDVDVPDVGGLGDVLDGLGDVQAEVELPLQTGDKKTLEPFDTSHVSYIASPELRDLVRRHPMKHKQHLDVHDVERMTKVTMAQSRIGSEDIEMTRELMANLLRTFDASAGGDTMAPQKKRGVSVAKTRSSVSAATKTRQTPPVTNRSRTNTRNGVVQQGTGRTARKNAASSTEKGSSLEVSEGNTEVPPFLLMPRAEPADLSSPIAFDIVDAVESADATFAMGVTDHMALQGQLYRPHPDEWVDAMFAGSSPNLTTLCDVKLLVSPSLTGEVGLAIPSSRSLPDTFLSL